MRGKSVQEGKGRITRYDPHPSSGRGAGAKASFSCFARIQATRRTEANRRKVLRADKQQRLLRRSGHKPSARNEEGGDIHQQGGFSAFECARLAAGQARHQVLSQGSISVTVTVNICAPKLKGRTYLSVGGY